MAMAMLLSIGTMNVFAITEEDRETITISASDVIVEMSDQEQVVNVVLYMDKDAEISNIDAQINIVDTDNLGVTFAGGATLAVSSMSGSINLNDGTTSGGISIGDVNAQHHMTHNEDLGGYVLVTIPFTVPANVTGQATVNFNGLNIADYDTATGYELTSSSVTATIEVKPTTEPEPDPEDPTDPQPGEFEIWYELDSSKDELNAEAATGTDNYMEYGIVDTNGDPTQVTATVTLKHTGEATILQAYDIYLTYDEDLKYVSHNMTGAAAYAAGSETAIAADATNVTVAHIQAVSEDFDAVTMANGAEITLGTITFEIADAAAYDEELHITLTEGTNSKTVTNISVGGDAVGDQNSYYPDVTGTVLGAEVNTTYIVTFYDGTTVLDTEEVGHNQTVTQPEDPEKENFTFDNWYADASFNTAFDFSKKITANTSVYAKFNQDTVTVTWYDTDNITVLDTDTVNSGAAASYDESTYGKPSKPADAQYTYTFIGWNTTKNATTALTNLTVTKDTAFYPVFSATTNTYTVIWNNWDNSLLEKDENVPYGTTPSYDGETPTRVADAQYTYTHSGWTPAIQVVKGEATYTATYTETVNKYTVTYSAGEGATLNGSATEEVEYGKAPTLRTTASKDGYEFIGWYIGDAKVDSTYQVTGPVTLTAKYEAKDYTVSFNANGGSGSMAPETVKYDASYTVPQNAFTAPTGKSFVGWNTAANGSGRAYTAGSSYTNLAGTNDSVTLFAQWDDVQYTITIDDTLTGGSIDVPGGANYPNPVGIKVDPADGYELVPDSVTYIPDGGDEGVKIPVSDANGDGIYEGSFNMPADNIEVTAEFKKIVYNITYVENGGSDVADDTYTVTDEVTLPTTSTKSGYKFIGWYDNDMLEGAAVNKIEVGTTGNKTFYAKWDGYSYTIKFNGNGATNNVTMSDVPAKYGENVTLSANTFEKTGYTFKGWATSAAGAKEHDDKATVSNLTTTENGSVTLYAVWEANTVVVTKDYNYDGKADEIIEVTYDGKYYPTLTDPNRDGYTFDGWYTDATAGDKITAETIVNKAETHTLYAHWSANPYKVTLDYNYEGKDDGEITVTYGEKYYPTLTDTTRGGYTFEGWYTDETAGEKITVDTVMNKAEAHTLYAHWTIETYTIKFDANGGTVDRESLIYKVTDSFQLPTPTKANYTFTGWKLETAQGSWNAGNYAVVDDKGNTINYTNQHGVKDQTMTLTAQWIRAAQVEVEQYMYAGANQWLLRVTDNLESGKVYKFDSAEMYYINDEGYNIGGTAVYYTLISEDNLDITRDGDGNITSAALKDASYDLLTGETGSRNEINYNGDINGDGVINIADANIVYQMVSQQSAGSYYNNLGSANQSDVLSRLKADMNKSITNADHRGSTLDVDAIIDIINS